MYMFTTIKDVKIANTLLFIYNESTAFGCAICEVNLRRALVLSSKYNISTAVLSAICQLGPGDSQWLQRNGMDEMVREAEEQQLYKNCSLFIYVLLSCYVILISLSCCIYYV